MTTQHRRRTAEPTTRVVEGRLSPDWSKTSAGRDLEVEAPDDVLRLVGETVYTVHRKKGRVQVTLVPPGNSHDPNGGTVSFVLETERVDDSTERVMINYESPVWSLAYDIQGLHRPEYPLRCPLWWCYPTEKRHLYTYLLLAVDALLLRGTFGAPLSVREGDEVVALVRGIGNGVLREIGDIPEHASVQ